MPVTITNGPTGSAGRFVIHGPPGVGKTTLSDLFPGPVIHIDLEQSTVDYDVKRIECFTWRETDEAINFLLTESHPFKTVAFDTVTAWENQIEKKILAEERKNRMADFSYGRDSKLTREETESFLARLDPLVRKGINVLLISHSVQKRIQPPELMDGYDKWQLAMDDRAAASIKRWAKGVLFLNFKTLIVETDERKTRGTGGEERIITTRPKPYCDAKVRVDLPTEIVFRKGVWPAELDALFSVPTPKDELFDQFCEIVQELKPEALKAYLVERGTIKPEDDAQAIPEDFLRLVTTNPDGFKFAVNEFAKAKMEAAA